MLALQKEVEITKLLQHLKPLCASPGCSQLDLCQKAVLIVTSLQTFRRCPGEKWFFCLCDVGQMSLHAAKPAPASEACSGSVNIPSLDLRQLAQRAQTLR